MTPKIRIDYGEVEQAAKAFDQEGQTISQLVTALKSQAQSLHSTWTGRAADAFQREMEETLLPGLQRLDTALIHSAEVFQQIEHIFQDADQQVVGLFKNRDGSFLGQASGAGTGGGSGQGNGVDVSKYKNGIDGWSLISMDGSKGFKPSQLVSQIGSTCAIYAGLNLLIASGYPISQRSADTFADITKMQEAWWRPDMWFDDEPNWGFKMGVTEDVVSKWSSDYQTGNFSKGLFSGVDRDGAEKFLINNVQNGKPVTVLMDEDNSFGVSGGHFDTVIGVKTDANGQLQSVLTATNWAGSPVYEIPAKSFMDDWMNRMDGQYITVDHAPPPAPTPVPAHSFSDGLSEALSKGH